MDNSDYRLFGVHDAICAVCALCQRNATFKDGEGSVCIENESVTYSVGFHKLSGRELDSRLVDASVGCIIAVGALVCAVVRAAGVQATMVSEIISKLFTSNNIF